MRRPQVFTLVWLLQCCGVYHAWAVSPKNVAGRRVFKNHRTSAGSTNTRDGTYASTMRAKCPAFCYQYRQLVPLPSSVHASINSGDSKSYSISRRNSRSLRRLWPCVASTMSLDDQNEYWSKCSWPLSSTPAEATKGPAVNGEVKGAGKRGGGGGGREGAAAGVRAIPPIVGDIRRESTDTLVVRHHVHDAYRELGRDSPHGNFVELFRGSAPYIRAHQGAVMVAHIGGESLDSPNFPSLMDDFGLICLLGVKLVLVTGAQPQISSMLEQAGIKAEYRDGMRITSPEALKVIKAAAGFVRIEVESALTRGGRGSNCCNVSGGNYYSAQPVGVKDGLDFKCTGVVRRVDATKIRAQLDEGDVVQLTCIGYSASGEVFNVDTRDLASKCAASVGASKLIYIDDGAQIEDTATGETIQSLRLSEARSLVARYVEEFSKRDSSIGGVAANGAGHAKAAGRGGASGFGVEVDFVRLLENSIFALSEGVPRAHVVPPTSGALLEEIYTRDGAGLLISRDIYDGIRQATSSDIPGITEITTPLEESGVLMPRPPEQLEADILRNEYFVITRDAAVLGVAFLRRYGQEHGEIGCLAIHHVYRKRGWGEAMLSYLERVAIASSIKHVFVLSSRTMQWFVERGFDEAEVSDLPEERARSYNWQRMSKIYTKTLGGGHRGVDAEELLWNVRGMV